MSISERDFIELQQRVTLLEGGNTPYQKEVLTQLNNVGHEIQQLAENTTRAIITMRSELGLSIDGVEEQLTENINSVKLTLNEKFDRLLNYLEAWVGVGNVNMDNIKAVVQEE